MSFETLTSVGRRLNWCGSRVDESLSLIHILKAQLRRYKKYSPGIITEKIPSELSYNKLCLNVQTHECLLDGEPVSLTPTEFSILHVLLSSAGNVVSIEELFHAVWKDEYYSKNSSTITVHIRHCLLYTSQQHSEKTSFLRQGSALLLSMDIAEVHVSIHCAIRLHATPWIR